MHTSAWAAEASGPASSVEGADAEQAASSSGAESETLQQEEEQPS